MKKLFTRAVSAIKEAGRKVQNFMVGVAVTGAAVMGLPSPANALDPTAAVAAIDAGTTVVDTVTVALLGFAVAFLVGWAIYRKVKNG